MAELEKIKEKEENERNEEKERPTIEEMERQTMEELERQLNEALERQKIAEVDRQKNVQLERQTIAELERQLNEALERQKIAEVVRQKNAQLDKSMFKGVLNHAFVSNKTNTELFIIAYSCSDLFCKMPTDKRQVPVDGEFIEVTGLAGGGAVQVAVIYNVFPDGSGLVCDLFRVKDKGDLILQEVTKDCGVTSYGGADGAKPELVERGTVISLDAKATAIAKEVLKVSGPIAATVGYAAGGLGL